MPRPPATSSPSPAPPVSLSSPRSPIDAVAVAGAAVDHVVAAAAVDQVGAGAAAEQVVAEAAEDRVVALAAPDHVALRRAVRHVVAGGADDLRLPPVAARRLRSCVRAPRQRATAKRSERQPAQGKDFLSVSYLAHGWTFAQALRISFLLTNSSAP